MQAVGHPVERAGEGRDHVLTPLGQPLLQLLTQGLGPGQIADADPPPRGLVFMAFDLLYLDGEDLRREAVEARRARLRELLGANEAARVLQFSDHVVGGGPDFFHLPVAQ